MSTVTSRAEIYAAIRTRFATEIATPLGLVTRYDNDARETPTSGLWALVTILPGSSDVGEFGAVQRYRTLGVCIASIFQPVGEGDGASLEVADAIVPAFRARSHSGVHYRTPSVERLGRTGDGAWFQTNVTIPWYADEIAARP